MKKYFIQFNGVGCTLAVEKHLYTFIREKYEHAIVPENFIPVLVQDLKREQDAYFLEHRGNPVNIESHASGVNGNHFLNAGNICCVLLEIRREF